MANLPIIQIQKLRDGQHEEVVRLLSACQQHGFFYLGFDGVQSIKFVESVDKLFSEFKSYFEKPLDIKFLDQVQDPVEANLKGFKPIGTETGVSLNKQDGFEAIKIPANGVLHPSAGQESGIPQGCADFKDDILDFMESAYDISNTIMAKLSAGPGMPTSQHFQDFHKKNLPSASSMVVNHYLCQDLPAESSIGQNAHTDLGSITILFCTDWGLQVYDVDSATWSYVPPLIGHAIINVGDTLRFLSGGRLRSSLHRVVPHPNWKNNARYSMAYFARPNYDTEFKGPDGNNITAIEWTIKKFSNFKESHDIQAQSSIQAGMENFLGTWESEKEIIA